MEVQMSMFQGMCAFPLTPMNETSLDEAAFGRLVDRLAVAGVDSIGALGSTGSYAYLSLPERRRIARLAVEHAGGIPVMVGIGALRLRDVLQAAEDAQSVGASAVLLAPVSYQALTPDDVWGLYEAVSASLSVPLCVYDNPHTTRFLFSDELHGRISRLPNVASIKIPAVPGDSEAARRRVDALRSVIAPGVGIGVSGDASAIAGLVAGCDAWYSVIGGLFPEPALALTRAAASGDVEGASRLSEEFASLWAMFQRYGSLRVVAAAAEILGLAKTPCLPLPLRAIEGEAREALAGVLRTLDLA